MPFLTIDRNDAIRARTAASLVSDAAADLRDSAIASMSHARRPMWTGPHREGVLKQLAGDAASLRGAAGRAETLASELIAHAAWIESETDRLDRVAVLVRNHVAANPEDPLALELAASGEPHRWNLRWDQLATRIGAGSSVLTSARYF